MQEAWKEAKARPSLVTLADGDEVVDYLDGAAGRRLPQLVILDLKMPRMSGLEALR